MFFVELSQEEKADLRDEVVVSKKWSYQRILERSDGFTLLLYWNQEDNLIVFVELGDEPTDIVMINPQIKLADLKSVLLFCDLINKRLPIVIAKSRKLAKAGSLKDVLTLTDEIIFEFVAEKIAAKH